MYKFYFVAITTLLTTGYVSTWAQAPKVESYNLPDYMLDESLMPSFQQELDASSLDQQQPYASTATEQVVEPSNGLQKNPKTFAISDLKRVKVSANDEVVGSATNVKQENFSQPDHSATIVDEIKSEDLTSQLIHKFVNEGDNQRNVQGADLPIANEYFSAVKNSSVDTNQSVDLAQELLQKTLQVGKIENRGVISLESGGFGENLWHGISRDRAETMLERIRENGIHSFTAKQLVRRAMLSQSTPPEGKSTNHWLAVRVQTLLGLGLVNDAKSLLTGINMATIAADASLAQSWTETAMLSGEVDAGCAFAQQYVLNTDAPFWKQAVLVCQAFSGNNDALRLGLDLAEDSVKNSNPQLFNMLENVQLSKFELPLVAVSKRFSPLESILLARFNQFLTPNIIPKLPESLLRQVMHNSTLNQSTRLQAAESLVDQYQQNVDVTSLAKLYSEVMYDKETFANPMEAAKQEVDGSIARALFWQASAITSMPSHRAMALEGLWERAESDSLQNLPSQLSPDLRGVHPNPSLAWFAPKVVKVALRGGNYPLARAWWQVLKFNRGLAKQINMQKVDLELAFGLLEGKLEDESLANWWRGRLFHSLPEKLYAQRTLAILEAIDIKVPNHVWKGMHVMFSDADQSQQPAGPGPLWLRLVASSLEDKNTGEAILMLVEPLMFAGAANMAPQSIANIISGLRFMGLNSESSSLALEAMLADGQGVI